MEAVLACVQDWPHETMAVVGSSLGGFYATWLAEKLGCKAALLNPAVYPARDLASQLGEHAHWHDPQQHFVFETMHVQELKSMELAKITQPARYFAVIAKGDEVLDWHEMAGHFPDIKMKLLPASDHALSDFDEHLGDVIDFLDH